jgi:hypothetical protein
MGSAVAVAREGAALPAVRSRAEFRELLDRALREVDGERRAGALLRATGLRVRFEFPDLEMSLNVSAADEGEQHLRWSFDDGFGADWEPKLELRMDSAVANAYLQGRESLAIGIARRQVRCQGSSRVALLYVPAIRLLCEPYRRIAEDDYPHLLLT